uniref:Uncharacterized protein n=1 Tax=Nomascus leucogenys TaxID=61853 RepID=A0A2I3GYE4_NOMLE
MTAFGLGIPTFLVMQPSGSQPRFPALTQNGVTLVRTPLTRVYLRVRPAHMTVWRKFFP